MAYDYFSRGGKILPIGQAMMPLGNVAYSYGFGVYATIRLSKGKLYFLDEHCQRLMNSAAIIGLDHPFTAAQVKAAAKELIAQNKAETCNLKILLIGGQAKDDATLDILCLNPLFPDRKLYKQGAACVTYRYQRNFPGAKTLNMLPSYLAYRSAKQAGAYDALLINRDGCVVEGTRTNFLALKGRTIVSPPAKDILPGVTRRHVLEVARQTGFQVVEKDIKLTAIGDYDTACLTSTSSKILPIRVIDNHDFGMPTAVLKELVLGFDRLLANL